MNLKVMPEILHVPSYQFMDYITARTDKIVAATQGDTWDDPEEWLSDAIELAHAVKRLLNESRIAI